jgi:signal peptidase I
MTLRRLYAYLAFALLFQPLHASAQANVVCCHQQQSGSMLPTIPAGSQISHIKYNNSADIQRGDIVIYIVARNATQLMHRLVGLPGDRIQMRKGQLFINDTAVPRKTKTTAGSRTTEWEETLPGGPTFTTLDLVDGAFYDDTPVYTVPSNHYFFMGDNRDNSTDSRVLSQVGYIPFRDIVGRVVGF